MHRVEKELREHGGGGAEPTVNGKPMEVFLTSFEWDQARYPVKSALSELTGMIQVTAPPLSPNGLSLFAPCPRARPLRFERCAAE